MTERNAETDREESPDDEPIVEIPEDVVRRSGLLDADDVDVVETEDGLLLRPTVVTYAGP